MKNLPAVYALYEIPELEETEFTLSVSPCPRIEDEDARDGGHIGDRFSIAADVGNELPLFEF
jgi:hypothetical protein